MTKIEPNFSDIEKALSMLEPEQIAQLMGGITINNRMHKIDYSHKLRSIRTTDLYFSAEPKPHQLIDGSVMTPDEYNGHRQGVWEQIMSGVDL
tara:strand:+ start:2675 stop:2953 length:279 start_codon:yes stop_codon:yes gene_type:complete